MARNEFIAAVSPANKRLAQQYCSRQQPPTAALDAEIARLQALLNETQRQTSALVAQRQRI
jgi:hypothetical protein